VPWPEVNANFYVALGCGANALWGAAFIIPYALHDFPAELITIFRYLVYGIISIAVLLLLGLGNVKISLPVFMVANAISFCNVGYYLFLTMGVKYSGFVYPALIIGLLPVSVIVLGVFQDKKQSFLVCPGIGLIVSGIVLINILNVNDVSSLMLMMIMCAVSFFH
jgi:drug/metabolite transporter (DMT)-like permease